MKRLTFLALALAGGLGLFASAAGGVPGGDTSSWRVTITNLTPPGSGPPGSQPLSPPLFVVHTKRANVWSLRTIATHPVAAIAEDANNAPAESALAQLRGVESVFTGEGGPIPSGESRTYIVKAVDADRLTVVTMLVNTNDAFTGLDSARLPDRRVMAEKMAYDAGSEKNNELKAFIPGPCCGNPFVRDPEGELIRMHEGITGRGDLDPDKYDWDGPAARIVVQPM
jgi:hypothetical protein